MSKYAEEHLSEIITKHRMWLEDREGGIRADLSGADLRYADLRYADLSGADLRYADLKYADLRCARNAKVPLAMTEIVPREGSFSGWKKALHDGGECTVKLRIAEDALRSNATGRKCRCSKAEVAEIVGMDGTLVSEAWSSRDESFRYRVGETVEVADFDTNRLNECSAGIHFFLTPEEARAYAL